MSIQDYKFTSKSTISFEYDCLIRCFFFGFYVMSLKFSANQKLKLRYFINCFVVSFYINICKYFNKTFRVILWSLV